VKADSNASNRYNAIIRLLTIQMYRTNLTANQIDDIEKLIDNYVENDDSLVHRFKLILSKEFTAYDEEYNLNPIIDEIISRHQKNGLTETDHKIISILSLYLWDKCLEEKKLVSFWDGSYHAGYFTDKIIQLFGELKIAPAYPIVRIFSQLRCPDDYGAEYWGLFSDYYPDDYDVLYEIRKASIIALINFGGDDVLSILERRITNDPNIRLKKIALSGLFELNRDRAYDFMMNIKYFISIDQYEPDASELMKHIKHIFPSRDSKKELSILFQGLVDKSISYDMEYEKRGDETSDEAIIREIGWLTEEDVPFLMKTLSSNKNEFFRHYAALALKILDLNNTEIMAELENILQQETISDIKDVLTDILRKNTQ